MYFRHNNVRYEQSKLIEDMKDVVEAEGVGLFEAPTGLGKTDASLAATLDFALKNNKKVFFVTPKNSQHKIVVDAIKGINKKHNAKIRVIDLVAKPNLCSDPFLFGAGSEFYELCDKKVKKKMCDGYINTVGYNKEQKAKAEYNIIKFARENFALTHDELRLKCLKNPILCPYELSLRLAKEALIIITDVNHIFLPSIRQKLFAKMGIELKDCIFIFDEAHNLASRLRNALSVSLNEKQVENALVDLEKVDKKEYHSDLIKFLEDLLHIFHKIEKGYLQYDFFNKLFENYDYNFILSNIDKANNFFVDVYEKKSYLENIRDFFIVWYNDEKSYTRFVDDNKKIHIKSLDPSFLAAPILNDSFASLLMSATLTPFEMYVDLLGVEKKVFKKRYNSPFKTENKLTLYSTNLTTKYEERQKNIPKIADTIVEIINTISGNIAVYFPSYKLLESVYSLVVEKTAKRIFVQKPNMPILQAKRLIKDFKSMQTGFGGVLFAVVGGSFSEGVDFPGEDLIGTIVVGLPFPEPDFEVKALIDYYDFLYKKGWDYAYVFPTIAKIVQASGRAIRTESDRAFIVLLDKRYVWNKYKQLFPADFIFTPYNIEKIKEFMKK